jgi:hypothetical protein
MQGKDLVEKQNAWAEDECIDDSVLVEAAFRISEPSFAAVWNNPNDAEYDKLWAVEVP